ncbi:hypothetical protein ACKWTF_011337 [Chironomus riparius]
MKLTVILLFISFSNEIKALSKTIYKSAPDHIECSANKLISIEYVERNINISKGKHHRKFSNICNYNLTLEIKENCDVKIYCVIDGTKELLGDSCDNWIELNVTYQCVDHVHYLDQKQHFLTYQDDDKLTEQDTSNQNKTRTKRAAKCPNRVFERKHVCRNCRFNNLNDVVNFARAVEGIRDENNWANTNLNSVFAGSPSYTPRGTRCIFSRPIRKYNCYRRGGNWSCFLDANRYATHDLNSGHYDHRQDV